MTYQHCYTHEREIFHQMTVFALNGRASGIVLISIKNHHEAAHHNMEVVVVRVSRASYWPKGKVV